MLLLPRALSQFRLAALALVLLTVVTRLPSLLHPWSIDDEAVYSVVAHEIVDGGRPYVDAVERKPPLLFWLYAGIFEATGKFNPAGLHAVALGWTLATMAGLYVIGRQLFDRGTGLVAALLYSVYQPWGTFKNLAFNGEMIMNLPLVWACAIVFARSSLRLRPELLVAGALLGAAFLSDSEHRDLLSQAGFSEVTTRHLPRTNWICAIGRRPATATAVKNEGTLVSESTVGK